MSTSLTMFNFHGDAIECIPEGDFLWVAIRPICVALGVDDKTQREKLAARSWATLGQRAALAADGRERELFCIDLDSLPMWLATIDERRVPEGIRPKLIRYQREAKKALADFFFKKTDPRDALIADLRRQLATQRGPAALRPTDIAAAWARAHLEASKEPLPLREAWARYVVWSQEKGLPMPLHLSTLSSGVAAMFHQVRQPGRVAYYCAFRAEPLPVELPEPQSRQQALPFAAQQHDGPDLADRALRVLERHPGGLGAEHMAQVLGAPVPVMTAVLGGMVEAGALGVKPAAARLLYRVAEREPEQAPMTDIQRRVYEYMETQPPGQRIPTQEIAKAIGCDLSPSQLSKVGMAARALGYEQVRHESGSGWRKPEVN